jgi:hypothetical protein
MDALEVQRWLITGSLAYAAYTVWSCPCDPLGACHLPHLVASTGVPLAVLLYLNRAQILGK